MDRRVGRDRAAVTAAAVVAAAFIAVMVVWPLVAVLARSLAGVGPADVLSILSRSSVRSVVGFTLLQATLSAALTVVLGLPIAHLLARFRFRGKAVLRAAVVVPFVLPTVVVAAAVDAVFERFGLRPATSTGSGVSLLAILYAHIFFNLAVVARLVGGYWAGLDHRQVEAARVLGAGRLEAWWSITLRQLRPAIIGAALVVFLFSFTSFGVIRVLGGLRTATIETEIHRYAIARAEFDTAAVLAGLQIVVVVVLSVLTSRFQRRFGVTSNRVPTHSAGSWSASVVPGRSRRPGRGDPGLSGGLAGGRFADRRRSIQSDPLPGSGRAGRSPADVGARCIGQLVVVRGRWRRWWRWWSACRPRSP